MNFWKRLKHRLGLCHKQLLGYRCHGRDDYAECGYAIPHYNKRRWNLFIAPKKRKKLL